MKKIQVYGVGEYYENNYAIRCKDVKNIDEAREIILSMTREWQNEYTDEEYIKTFGYPKLVIEHEETCYLRYTGQWIVSGYEYKEADWVMSWKKTDIKGQGAMKCYVFYLRDTFGDFVKYMEKTGRW